MIIMETLLLSLSLLVTILVGMELSHKFTSKKVTLWITALTIATLDYFVLKYMSKFIRIDLYKFLWVQIVLLILVPLLFKVGKKLGTTSSFALSAVGGGLIVLILSLHSLRKEGEQKA